MSTTTKERPIMFSAPVIQAIRDGRKTETRRVIKDATGAFWDHAGYRPVVDGGAIVDWLCVDTGRFSGPGSPTRRCPHGKPGDILWVKRGRFCKRADADLFLRVVDVRAERLQEIGKDGRKAKGVLAEGISRREIEQQEKWFHKDDAPAIIFYHIWNSLNAKRGYPWDSNPWVWVVKFDVMT